MNREQAIPLVLGLGEGTFVSFGLNYAWETLKLPGYNVAVIPFPLKEGLSLGADDIGVIALGAGIIVGASGKLTKKPPNYHVIGVGAGIIIGQLLTKVFEARGAVILPLSYGKLPLRYTVQQPNIEAQVKEV